MFTAITTLALGFVAATEEGSHRVGADFFVVGDFGWVRDMTDPNMVFDAIDKVKKEAEPNSIDDA
jgi:hypothetical protein